MKALKIAIAMFIMMFVFTMSIQADNKEKKPNKPNGPNCNKPHYTLPVDQEIFERLFDEAFTQIVIDFSDELKLKERIERTAIDTLDKVLVHHIEKATRDELKK